MKFAHEIEIHNNEIQIRFHENEIQVKWKDGNTLIIEYSEGAKLRSKKEEIYNFGEIVRINYKEVIKK